MPRETTGSTRGDARGDEIRLWRASDWWVADDRGVLGTVTVRGSALAGRGDGAESGTSVTHVTVVDGRVVDVEYDPEPSERPHAESMDRLRRFAGRNE